MTIREPQWDDLGPWARDLARRGLAAGAVPRSAVAVFDDEGAVLLGRPAYVGSTVQEGVAELVAVLGLASGGAAMAVAQPLRVHEAPEDDATRDAAAGGAMLVTRGWRDEGDVRTDSTVWPLVVADDGTPVFEDEPWSPLDEGPMERYVAHALGMTPVSPDEVDGVVYAADRFGHGIGAAPRWRAAHLRFRLDVDQVRREDRRRVRDLTRVGVGGRP